MKTMSRMLVITMLLLLALSLSAFAAGQQEKEKDEITGEMIEPNTKSEEGKYKIGLSMSYYGNGWQTENMNACTALSRVPPFNEKVELFVTVSGPSVQRQNAQINELISKGCDAIILFAISPNGLNRTLQKAIDKGIIVIAYSSGVTNDDVYFLGVDLAEQGRVMAEWVAKQINFTGNVLLNTGVAGTDASMKRVEAAMKVFDSYPDLKVVAQTNGDWSSAVSQVEATKALASHPNIDGVYSEAGAGGIVRAMIGLGLPLVPTTGEATAGYVRMLADPEMQNQGLSGMVTADPGYDAALALKMAVDILEGKEYPKQNVMELPILYMDDLKEGTDISAGANVFPVGMVPDDFFVQMYHPELPLDLEGYLTGNPGPQAIERAKKLLNE